MSNLQKYISERQVKDSEFAANYESGYQDFKIGVYGDNEPRRNGIRTRTIGQQKQNNTTGNFKD